MNYDIPFSELKVLGLFETLNLLKQEPNKWNVVSIWAEWYSTAQGKIISDPPNMVGAKSFIQEYFHDADYADHDVILCAKEQIENILNFAKTKRGEPLLVHCFAGISRSTAIATLILLDAIKDVAEYPLEDALTMVMDVRPQMLPNNYILNVGVPLVIKDTDKQINYWRHLYNSSIIRQIVGGR